MSDAPLPQSRDQPVHQLIHRLDHLDLADVLYRLAVCRYKLSSVSTSIALFDEALSVAERSGLPCDLLRSDILQRRSRCHRRLRDYVAAHDDVERALELGLGEFADLHPNVVAFEERLPNSEGQGAIHMAELVRRSLRMNPSRVIVGEVLGAGRAHGRASAGGQRPFPTTAGRLRLCALLGAVGAVVAAQAPEIKRYLKMKQM